MSTPAFTVPSNRRIRIELGVRSVNGPANQGAFLRIRDGALVNSALLMEWQINSNATGAGAGGIMGRTINNMSGGSHTLTATLEGITGNATLAATSTYPCWLEARDIGAV
jgi:hypothetical protein